MQIGLELPLLILIGGFTHVSLQGMTSPKMSYKAEAEAEASSQYLYEAEAEAKASLKKGLRS